MNYWKIRYYKRCYVLNFDDIIGDTIKEKYEGVYVKMMEIYRKYGGTRILCGPELASIFDTACTGFYPSESFTTNKLRRIHHISVPFYVDPNTQGDRMKIDATLGNKILRITNLLI